MVDYLGCRECDLTHVLCGNFIFPIGGKAARDVGMATVLVLGATGLLGHQLTIGLRSRHSVIGTTGRPDLSPRTLAGLKDVSLWPGVRAESDESWESVLREVRPAVVVNAIGIVKSRFGTVSSELAKIVNTRFPLNLSAQCGELGIRLIHISTDCVFSGNRGNYKESDAPDPVDAYGQTKLSGEPRQDHCLVLRTSFIGRELEARNGLLEWFRSHRGGRVRGFRRAVFSGMTTAILANVIGDLVDRFPKLSGTWHVAAEPIDKFRLLTLINDTFHLQIEIDPDDTVVCDRSLDGTAFRQMTGFRAPSWPEMITALAAECESEDC